MNKMVRAGLGGIMLGALSLATGCQGSGDSTLQKHASTDIVCTPETVATLQDAYMFGYPMVMMALTEARSTDPKAATPVRTYAPVNRFSHNRAYPDHVSKTVVKPNRDTYYSTAWLDLRKGPVRLKSPQIEPYHFFALYDAWSNVFETIGTRDGDAGPLSVLIVGPDGQGEVQGGETIVRAPTNMVWIIFRIRTGDGEAGARTARQVQDQLALKEAERDQPLAEGNLKQFDGVPVPIPSEAIDRMDTLEFFQTFLTLLEDNAPAATDRLQMERLKAIGLVPGTDLTEVSLFDGRCAEVARIPANTTQRFETLRANPPSAGLTNGWVFRRSGLGDYGTNYALRAYVARIGLGANLPQDAVYATAIEDSEAQRLEGGNAYRIRFEQDELPPARAFWSITVYDKDDFLLDHPSRRYSLTSSSEYLLGEDGSLTIALQANRPESDLARNWIATPSEGGFSAVLRVYWPEESVLSGPWSPPFVERVASSEASSRPE